MKIFPSIDEENFFVMIFIEWMTYKEMYGELLWEDLGDGEGIAVNLGNGEFFYYNPEPKEIMKAILDISEKFKTIYPNR